MVILQLGPQASGRVIHWRDPYQLGEPPGAKERGLRVNAIRVHRDSKRLTEIAQAAAEKKLVIPIAKRFPLAQVAEAHRIAEAGGAGKVLLTV